MPYPLHRLIIGLSFCLLCLQQVKAFSPQHKDPPFISGDTAWVDSVFKSLSPDERIAQLFMVAAFSNTSDKKHIEQIAKLVSVNKIGGLIFFKGGPVALAKLSNYYQSLSKTPLFIGIDGEWGLAMRLDSTAGYPYQMMLGAINDDHLIYELGLQMGKDCKRLGIHINFAPVLDINSNPANPIIGNRSFGEDKKNVARKGFCLMQGMQEQGVLAVGKHFPGHGDTNQDSHLTLPVINQPCERLDTLELYPFKQLITAGIGGIMVAHLSVPTFETSAKVPSSLSRAIVTDLLKNDLGFKGLVFTDALNMKGVSEGSKPGDVDLKALLAGNDVLLYSEDVPVAIRLIKRAIEKKEISQAEIDERCKKILAAKKWAGLNKYKPVQLENIAADLNSPESDLINTRLAVDALTLVKNEDSLIPLRRLDTLSIACVVVGDSLKNTFQQYLDLYTGITHFNIKKDLTWNENDSLVKLISKYKVVIVSLHKTSYRVARNYGISASAIEFIDCLADQTSVIVNLNASPYSLDKLQNLAKVKSILVNYQDNYYTQKFSAQAIFGGISCKGQLPVTASADFQKNTSVSSGARIRFKYTLPEEIGFSSVKLLKIDSLVNDAISRKAFPGCQVFVAKDGNVIYQKSFGYHTYEKIRAVRNDDLYDLASVTKIASTTISVMRLVDEGKVSLDDKLSDDISTMRLGNKKNLSVRDVLLHNARLASWIPFYLATLRKDGALRGDLYRRMYSDKFPLHVADSLFLRSEYKDTIYLEIVNSKLEKKNKYLYSDLGFYLLQKMIEEKTMTTQDSFAVSYFYKPMGLRTMTYNPLRYFHKERIVPTERDTIFRKQLIQGFVHDPGAAMLGGVGGHAGLFSDANDLAKLMQMLLWNGNYGGRQYLNKETITLFTSCPLCDKGNRRGLGFDKPELNPSKEGPTTSCISPATFGHTGFTGTCTWADPEAGIVYVFLSNRVYPDAENKLLQKLNVRTNIQQAIYDAMKEIP